MENIEAHITGTVWKIEVNEGDTVAEGDSVVILESMKMEMPVEAEVAGIVHAVLCAEGQAVDEGQPLVAIRTAPEAPASGVPEGLDTPPLTPAGWRATSRW